MGPLGCLRDGFVWSMGAVLFLSAIFDLFSSRSVKVDFFSPCFIFILSFLLI